MPARLQSLLLNQLDAALTRWRDASLPARPPSGWLKAIRTALGMSSAALGSRLGMTDSAVRKLEAAEAADAITLGTLRKLAAALDCELQYALVPRQALTDMRQQRAMQLAREQVLPVARSMALEDQAVDAALTESQIREVAQALLAGSGRGLW